jgi:hypothetical protein
VTLRIGNQLVGLRADTDVTLRRLRALCTAWIDDDHPSIPWAFDVRLDPTSAGGSGGGDHRRGIRPVPQLRAGQLLMARSRSADDVMVALATVLGGVLAHQDTTVMWSSLRPFAKTGRVVLVDAQPPALTADAALARAGIDELTSWCVAIDDATVRVPPPLHDLDWTALGLTAPPATSPTAELVGLVAVDRRADHTHGDHTHGEAFSRFAARHPSIEWFATVERLARDGRVSVTADRSDAGHRIIDLLGR